MLKGDLTTTPLAPLLVELADGSASGCLVIVDPTGEEALVYLKAGLVYSVSVPGTRPQLGAKLVSSGALAPEALAEALEAQRTELQGWRLGELLVHLGYVDQPVVEAFVKEQVSEALWDLLRWNDALWKFRKNVKAREDVGPPMAVVELLEALRRRGYEWETISAVVHGPGAIPKLSTRGDTNAETTLDNDAWSMLCKIDGMRSVDDLARDCGYTLFEAGHVIVSLVQAGLVDIDEDVDVAGDAVYGARALTSALAGAFDAPDDDPVADEDEDPLARLARLVNEVAGPPADSEDYPDDPHGGIPRHLESVRPHEPVSAGVLAPTQLGDDGDPMVVRLHRETPQSFAASLARVSTALSEVLGEAPSVDPHDLTARSLRRKAAAAKDDPDWQRRKKLRSAAAEELVTAQALVETLRPGHNVIPQPEYTGGIPKIVSHETEVRRAAEREAIGAQQAAEQAAADAETQRLAAEQEAAEQQAAEAEAARIAENDRLAAEEAEHRAAEVAAAEQVAAEAEAARVAENERIAEEEAAAEQAAAEEAERQAAAAEAERIADEAAEAERVAAEAAAAEEAERQAAEAAEAERIAEEERRIEEDRLAAEEAERQAAEAAEAERIADEERRIEEERLADEAAEAERVAAEAAAAEEAERQAAEAAEAERIAEEERLAAEAERIAEEDRLAAEAERIAEEDRLAAEEAERQAAEAERIADEERRIEEDRLAAEEAERQAAEAAEAERIAEEERRIEEDRLAAEEAERQAAEAAEAERIAEEEAAAERVAAEAAEAERIADEERRIEEERLAAEEAERQAAEAAEAERIAEEERLAAEAAAADQAAADQAAADLAADADRLAAEEEARVALEAAELASAQAEFSSFGDDLDDEGPLEIEEFDYQAAAYQEAIGAAAAAELAAAGTDHVAEDHSDQVDGAEAPSEIDDQREAERLAAEEAIHREDQAAAATALLIELSASAESAPEPAPQEFAEADDVTTDDDVDVAPEPEPSSWSDNGMADTAALLRELSSLGTEDEPEPQGPTTTRAPRTTSNDKKTKKKIGLFGL